MQDLLPAGGLRLYREGVEPSGPLRKVSGYIHPPFQDFACRKVRLRQAPFAGPEAVLAYLARYTHRVAISNSRLIGLDHRGVTFRFKDYRRNGRARHCTMTLVPGEFIRRFLLHVLPKGFHRIRHYGLLASATCKATIARAKELIAAPVAQMDPSTEHDNADIRSRSNSASAAITEAIILPCGVRRLSPCRRRRSRSRYASQRHADHVPADP